MVGHTASSAEAEPMRAEVEDEVAVVREHPEAHVDQVSQLVHSLDECVGSSETGDTTFIYHAVLPARPHQQEHDVCVWHVVTAYRCTQPGRRKRRQQIDNRHDGKEWRANV